MGGRDYKQSSDRHFSNTQGPPRIYKILRAGEKVFVPGIKGQTFGIKNCRKITRKKKKKKKKT